MEKYSEIQDFSEKYKAELAAKNAEIGDYKKEALMSTEALAVQIDENEKLKAEIENLLAQLVGQAEVKKDYEEMLEFLSTRSLVVENEKLKEQLKVAREALISISENCEGLPVLLSENALEILKGDSDD
jgi:chromosome segregation ATPase